MANILVRLLLSCGFVFGFGYFIMYNNKIFKRIEQTKKGSNSKFQQLIGSKLRALNDRSEKVASVNKGSINYKVYTFFKDIIINLDMEKDNVTPTGLIVFIASLSTICTIILSTILGSVMLVIPLFCALFYLITVIFKFSSLMRYERREAEIMDAVDLLVSDVKGGVFNAILRYKDVFNPNIRPYFLEFIDDVQNKGYGFKQAMLKLEDKLGINFTDFAQKAILYEEKADSDMDDIFSVIIEMNRCKRTLRYINNQEFIKLRTELVVSLIMIAGYCIFATATDPFLANFFLNRVEGKLLLVIDIVAIAGVLAYIAGIKAKSL